VKEEAAQSWGSRWSIPSTLAVLLLFLQRDASKGKKSNTFLLRLSQPCTLTAECGFSLGNLIHVTSPGIETLSH
jgi:hypothetical protein